MTEDEMQHLNRRFEDHLADYRQHIAEDLVKHERQDALHEQNMEAIKHLTASTQSVVDAYKILNGVQKFFKWISGFGVVIWIVNHYVTKGTL